MVKINTKGRILHPDLQLHLFELVKILILADEKVAAKSDLEILLITLPYVQAIHPKEKIEIRDLWEAGWLSKSIECLRN